MGKRKFLFAACILIAGAAVLLALSRWHSVEDRARPARPGFVQASGARFMLDGKPFRFVGANVAVMYRDDDRRMMGETLRQAAQAGIKVVRVWASGEGGPDDVKPIADYHD